MAVNGQGHRWRTDMYAGGRLGEPSPAGPEISIPAGQWWTMTGREGGETLTMQQVGPPLDAADPNLVAISGYRHRDDDPEPEWTVVLVRRGSPWAEDATGW